MSGNERFLTKAAFACAQMKGRDLQRVRINRMSWLLLLAWLSLPVPAAAEPQLIAAARPPYVVDSNGRATGPAVELLQSLARSIGAEQTVRILPFQRALLELEQGGRLYPALLRTPARESRFLWIGEVHADRVVLFSRSGSAPRSVSRIGVMRGSELQTMLQTFGLENAEAANSEIDNARLLRAGRIDGWFALQAVSRATWAQLKFPPADLQVSETFATVPFWIAASPDLPKETVRALRAAYRKLRADGHYRRIIAPLVALEKP